MIDIVFKDSNSLEGHIISDYHCDFIKLTDMTIWLKKHIYLKKYKNRIIYNCSIENGILLWDNDTIKWLIHDVPEWDCENYENLSDKEHWFILITLTIDNLSKILQILKDMNVQIFNSTLDINKLCLYDKLDMTCFGDDFIHVSKNKYICERYLEWTMFNSSMSISDKSHAITLGNVIVCNNNIGKAFKSKKNMFVKVKCLDM